MEHCHSAPQAHLTGQRIALIGNPNVGKSLLFHRLTGRYVTVSNYPGTTVELTQGAASAVSDLVVFDTPGIIAFPPRTEDEEVTARMLLDDHFQAIVQVGDAKNLRRTLHLTFQLAEMGVPLLLALNMMDEAQARGLCVDIERLSQELGITVIPTIATRGQGVHAVEQAIPSLSVPSFEFQYPDMIEDALEEICPRLPQTPISRRSLALLWLSEDAMTSRWLQEHMPAAEYQQMEAVRSQRSAGWAEQPETLIHSAREAFVNQLAQNVLVESDCPRPSVGRWLGRVAIHPLLGLPVLAVMLYGMYWFVGVFGSGTLVGLLEETLFGEMINPWVVTQVERLIPYTVVQQFLVGDYGIWTMGMTYALALLLPIVTTFFLFFGMLEDSGYLPRLAVLSNRIFRSIGLNGKAVLPMILGLGCVTMATMTTRILANKRDRLLVIFLLALAVPCSAQLGVVMGMLAGISLGATLIWMGVMLLVLLTVGWLAARLLPGERTPLLVELPPLRLPILSNVLIKTVARLEWYIKEAVPLFLLGTVLLFALDQLEVLPWLIEAGRPLITGWLGLPPEASSAFLLGFMRRDFAATGLFMVEAQGLLNSVQVLVAMITITLFIPCVASIFMIVKERGIRTAAAMALFILPFAFLIGGLVQRLLALVGWTG
ncbi:MAG TPA: ferrous iron transport protein B [Levilinea sp.]|nr:ferrous iron transport protein B [Levilinea sp.]